MEGRGPHENYWDHKSDAPYVRPQKSANCCDIRWIEFTVPDGPGLRMGSTTSPFGVSVWPYSAANQ